MIQKIKEAERLKEEKDAFWKLSPSEDTFYDEMIMGYGIGSSNGFGLSE